MLKHPTDPRPAATRTRRRRVITSVVCLVAFTATGATGWGQNAAASTVSRPAASHEASSRGKPAAAPTIAVGGNPDSVAVDAATHTAYVTNGVDNTVSVINTRTCDAHVVSGCGQHPPTIRIGPAGPGPVDAAVDLATDTVYVVSPAGDTVAVIDGRTCNAEITSGCTQTPAIVTVDAGPDGVAIDQATDTIYVANSGPNGNDGDTVSVIDGATCHAGLTTGCGQRPPTVRVGFGPVVPAVDEATDTIYVPNSNVGGAGTVSVINGRICNAHTRTGCGQHPPTIAVGFNTFPAAAAVDPTTDTVYEIAAGPSLGSVYVINGAICNSRVTSGCGQTAPTVTVGSVPIDVVVDPRTHSVFVANEEDSTVSVIDGAICNARDHAGCGQHPPVDATGFDTGYLDVNVATDTVYVANQDVNTVSVISGAGCSLNHQGGCRHPSPITTVGNAPAGIAVNDRTETVYVSNRSDNTLSAINASTCNGKTKRGCGRAWPTVATGPSPQAVAVNGRTDTVYTANSDPDDGSGSTVSVIDGATCSAHRTSGCDRQPTTVTVGAGPDALAVDEATNTVYVANGSTNTVSVIDGAECDAEVVSGCSAAPETITVGNHPHGVAIDQSIDSIYVSNGFDGTVSVINGAICNAEVTSGCDQTPSTIAAGSGPGGPNGIAINSDTDTVYVENSADSTVAAIDAKTCNATITSGCNQIPPTMAAGDGAFLGVAVDQRTDTVVLGSVIESAVDVYDGATCNATTRSGCGQQPTAVPTGGWPGNVAIDQTNDTVYAPNNVDGTVSLFGLSGH